MFRVGQLWWAALACCCKPHAVHAVQSEGAHADAAPHHPPVSPAINYHHRSHPWQYSPLALIGRAASPCRPSSCCASAAANCIILRMVMTSNGEPPPPPPRFRS